MDIPSKDPDTSPPSAEPAQRVGTKWFGGPITDLSRIGIPFFCFIVLGCACIAIFGGFGHDPAGGMREIARWLVTAGGLLACGIITGFLFAVPRTLRREIEGETTRSDVVDSSIDSKVDQGERDGQSPVRTVARYTVNSNLEQISDWLTKIIVGVGLVELYKLPGLASRASIFLAGGPNSNPQDRAFALGLILYFGVVGAVAGYLFTRVYVTGAFVRADIDNDRMS